MRVYLCCYTPKNGCFLLVSNFVSSFIKVSFNTFLLFITLSQKCSFMFISSSFHHLCPESITLISFQDIFAVFRTIFLNWVYAH